MKKLITAFALLLVFAFTGCAEIDQTERGVVLNFGKVSETIEPGLNFYNVITEEVVRIPVKTQLETMRVGAGSKDMQEVTVGVNVNYHIDPTKVADVYGQYGKDVVVTILQPKMRETITGVTPQYAPEEMLQKREEIRLRMENDLRAKLDWQNPILSLTGLPFMSSNSTKSSTRQSWTSRLLNRKPSAKKMSRRRLNISVTRRLFLPRQTPQSGS